MWWCGLCDVVCRGVARCGVVPCRVTCWAGLGCGMTEHDIYGDPLTDYLSLSFLHRVTEHKSVNMMESRNLAIVFWPTLAPPVVASIDTMARSMNMCLFVQTYIEHCEELFKED